jgi:hypothetical protein
VEGWKVEGGRVEGWMGGWVDGFNNKLKLTFKKSYNPMVFEHSRLLKFSYITH